MARKRRKRTSVPAMKKKAWALFSKLIRYSRRDSRDRCKCVTCGAKKHWKEMQAGHFISRKYSATLFDHRNVAPQCSTCNVINYGEQYKYGEYLKQKYGQDTIDELWRLARSGKQYTAIELTGMILDYQAELRELGYGIDT